MKLHHFLRLRAPRAFRGAKGWKNRCTCFMWFDEARNISNGLDLGDSLDVQCTSSTCRTSNETFAVWTARTVGADNYSQTSTVREITTSYMDMPNSSWVQCIDHFFCLAAHWLSCFHFVWAEPFVQVSIMSFQRFDSPPPASSERAESKRPHLSVFRFTSFQNASRRPSSTPPAYSPNDALATRNQLHAKILHWIRIAVSLVTLLASMIIIAFSARAIQTYTKTRNDAQWVLPLWPASVDLRPTHAMLACGIILAVASIFFVIAAFAPTVRFCPLFKCWDISLADTAQPLRATRTLNITSTVLAFLCIFITIFTAAFASSIDSHLSNSTQAGTLASWTCKWQGFGSAAPGHFSEICAESNAALDVVILMIVIEVFSVFLAGWGWWVGARLKKAERGTKGEEIAVWWDRRYQAWIEGLLQRLYPRGVQLKISEVEKKDGLGDGSDSIMYIRKRCDHDEKAMI